MPATQASNLKAVAVRAFAHDARDAAHRCDLIGLSEASVPQYELSPLAYLLEPLGSSATRPCSTTRPCNEPSSPRHRALVGTAGALKRQSPSNLHSKPPAAPPKHTMVALAIGKALFNAWQSAA